MATLEIDNMEYASDALAKVAYDAGENPGTGGEITYVDGYYIHKFTASGTFVPPANATNFSALVIAGGGGGCSFAGAGGGAGGVVYNSNLSLTTQSYPVTVGAGGAGGIGAARTIGTTGENSVFAGMTANGGGGGGGYTNGVYDGLDGGSGGGTIDIGRTTIGHATQSDSGGGTGYGNNGGYGGSDQVSWTRGGGGGGAGGVGGDSVSNTITGAGGIGITNSITGSPVDYAGGGSGGGDGSGPLTVGTASHGGGLGSRTTAHAGDATDNTGGGGGGGGGSGGDGGDGGDGVVIVKYMPNGYLSVQSESIIKTQGNYSLKFTASQNLSENIQAVKTFSTHSDLTGVGYLRFDMRSTRIGSNIKLTLHNSNETITELTPNILVANVFQEVIWNISAVADADKNDIDQFIITVINADADNTFYLDYFGIYSGGAMTQVKVSQLTPVTAIADDDLLLVSQDVGGGSFVSKSASYSTIRGVYTRSFVNSDLVANILTVNHGLNEAHALSVTIENNSGKMLGPPDDVVYTDVNNLTIDFTSLAPLTGTWYLRVSK